MDTRDSMSYALGLVGGLTAIFYAAGFVVASTYLSYYGVTDISLAKARYLSVGILFLSLAVLTLAPSFLLVHFLFGRGLPFIFGKRFLGVARPGWSSENKILFLQGIIYGLALFILLSVIVPAKMIRMVSITGTGSYVLEKTDTLKGFYSEVWSITPDWFLPLLFCGMFAGMSTGVLSIRGYMNNRIKTLLEKPKIIITSYTNTHLEDQTYPKEKIFKLFMDVVVCFVILLSTIMFVYQGIVALHTYAIEVYPRIKNSFGGGDFGYVKFVVNNSNSEIIRRLIPMEDKLITEPVKLLSEGNASYAVLCNTDGKSAIMVDKRIVLGIKATRPSVKATANSKSTSEPIQKDSVTDK